MSRRSRFFARLVGACIALGASPALAQSYPSHPVRLVVPFPAGGALDVLGRAAATQVAAQIGQPVVVDNRPGANGIIGTEIVVSAPPTGYTVLNNGAALVINHASHRKLSYELDKHLAPVTSIGRGTGYLVLVSASSPARSMKELTAAARSEKGPTRYGSPGVANPMHLASAMLAARMGIDSTHIPYKGIAPAITALLGGEVQLVLSPPALAAPHVTGGKLRAIAFTGASRWPALPEVPTVSESGIQSFTFSGGFVGWHVPGGTPRPVVLRLQEEVRKALQTPKLREFVEANGYTPGGESPAEFGAFINSELARYREAVKAAKLELQ